MPATFDGVNLVIDLPASVGGVLNVDAQVDLYSDWKEWVKISDNAKFPPAFRTIAGDPVGGGSIVSPYYFVRNDLGWRLRPADEDHEVTIVGNLFPQDESLDLFDERTGRTITIRSQVSPQSLTATSAVGLTAGQDARLVLVEKILRNKMITDPGTGVLTVYDDDGSTPLLSGNIYEDAAAGQAYRGQGSERRERLS